MDYEGERKYGNMQDAFCRVYFVNEICACCTNSIVVDVESTMQWRVQFRGKIDQVEKVNQF